jgi:DNA-binding response OmpR family regulator
VLRKWPRRAFADGVHLTMARVLLLTADLLFGSRVQGDLSAAGHEVELMADELRVRARLEEADEPTSDVLVLDLTDERLDGTAIVGRLTAEDRLSAIRTLGYYSHVDLDVRVRAERAGFDLVVPRSRMAREGAELVTRLAR